MIYIAKMCYIIHIIYTYILYYIRHYIWHIVMYNSIYLSAHIHIIICSKRISLITRVVRTTLFRRTRSVLWRHRPLPLPIPAVVGYFSDCPAPSFPSDSASRLSEHSSPADAVKCGTRCQLCLRLASTFQSVFRDSLNSILCRLSDASWGCLLRFPHPYCFDHPFTCTRAINTTTLLSSTTSRGGVVVCYVVACTTSTTSPRTFTSSQ